MLAVHVERERLSAVLAAIVSPTAAAAAASSQPRGEGVAVQDHDAEERGVLSNGDIELQPMTLRELNDLGNDERDVERDAGRESLLAEPPRRDSEDDDTTAVDAFWSGTAIVADFHILDTLRKQWADYGNASASALQTMGFSAEFAAITANERLSAASARFQRNMQALGT